MKSETVIGNGLIIKDTIYGEINDSLIVVDDNGKMKKIGGVDDYFGDLNAIISQFGG